MVLKWKDIYIEHFGIVSQIDSLKMEGIVKQRGLKLKGPLYMAGVRAHPGSPASAFQGPVSVPGHTNGWSSGLSQDYSPGSAELGSPSSSTKGSLKFKVCIKLS